MCKTLISFSTVHHKPFFQPKRPENTLNIQTLAHDGAQEFKNVVTKPLPTCVKQLTG